ncbi:hypothetical protein CDL15_Pgr000576 [Punica granatum]|nr:hypothetical protein CDL15_Pgr000576 [Punica granatum]
MVSSDNVVSSVSLREVFISEEATPRPEVRALRTTTSGKLQLHSVHERTEGRRGDGLEVSLPLIAPLNMADQERMAWLRKNLQEFDIFKSDNLTRKFHGQVMKFFASDCGGTFFMTWISPARFFGSRELLAVESLFKTNPGACLIILSRTLDSRAGHEVLKPITNRGCKVIPLAPDLPSLFQKTPVEVWFDELRSGKVDPGEIPLAQNLSNLIRLAVLYKYGGVYLDTDFIVFRDFTQLRNSIGAQSVDPVSGNWTRINNAVMVFDRHHPLLVKFMREYASTFDGNKWGHNGPYLVSRVVEKIQERRQRGSYAINFTVLSPMAFYPVGWTRIGGLFEQPKSRFHERWVEAKVAQLSGVGTYGVHLWNKQSRGFRIEEGSVLGRLISNHCMICEGIYRNPTGSSSLQ